MGAIFGHKNVTNWFFSKRLILNDSFVDIVVKFIYSEKATKLLSFVVPVKSNVKILQNFVAFSARIYEL